MLDDALNAAGIVLKIVRELMQREPKIDTAATEADIARLESELDAYRHTLKILRSKEDTQP